MARTGRPASRKRTAVRNRRPVECLQESFGSAISSEAVALIETVSGVEADSSVALRKNIKSKVTIDADRLLVERPRADVVDQKPAQDVMDRIGKPFEPDLTRDRRTAAIGSNDDSGREGAVQAGVREFNSRRKPGTDLNAIDAAKQRGAGNNRGSIEGVANPGMPQIHGASDTRNHLIHRKRIFSGVLRRKLLAVWNRPDRVVSAGALQDIQNSKGLGLRHAPRHNEFAANPVDMNRRLLQQCDAVARTGKRNRERAARYAGSHDDDVGPAIRRYHWFASGISPHRQRRLIRHNSGGHASARS
jgi:hypothetical protein